MKRLSGDGLRRIIAGNLLRRVVSEEERDVLCCQGVRTIGRAAACGGCVRGAALGAFA
jgi:hypothetical protein